MYEAYYAYLGTLEQGTRQLHHFDARQEDYFTYVMTSSGYTMSCILTLFVLFDGRSELAGPADMVVGEEIHEMFRDAQFIRVNFPQSYRFVEYGQDPTTGKWIRRFKPNDSSPELVVEFSGWCLNL